MTDVRVSLAADTGPDAGPNKDDVGWIASRFFRYKYECLSGNGSDA